jgi:AcrR family transcriptional regulator
VTIQERKQRQRRQVRDAILAAAREIAARDGWTAVTIRKLAERIEYSPPVVYEHFASKEEILLELLRQGYAEQRVALEAAAHDGDGPEQALRAIGRAYVRFARENPDLYQVMYGLGGASFSARAAEEARRLGEQNGAVPARVIESIEREEGRASQDVTDKVTLLWGTVHGLVALAMAGRLPGGHDEVERFAVVAVRDAVAAWRSEP